MPENNEITTGIDVETAISEIAEREVSEAKGQNNSAQTTTNAQRIFTKY